MGTQTFFSHIIDIFYAFLENLVTNLENSITKAKRFLNQSTKMNLYQNLFQYRKTFLK